MTGSRSAGRWPAVTPAASRRVPLSATVFIVVSLISCVPPSPAPAPTPAPTVALVSSSVASRVVLLSFDGLGADALALQKDLPAFERLAREGASARVINVDPTLTIPTHVAMLTGAAPDRTGIVANRFHVPGTAPELIARGMQMDSDVETLVETARRQGKRVGTLTFPTIDNRTARRTSDFGMAWPDAATAAEIVELTRADFRREWVPPTWTTPPQRRTSFSPIMRARLEWRVPSVLRTDVDVVAYDTTDDRVENYDRYAVESGDEDVPVDARGWFAISRNAGDALYGSWSKFLHAEPALGVTIYRGAVARNEAWPASFRDALDAEAGFWPGSPDDATGVDPATFTEQVERMAAFYGHAQALAMARMPFDLLLVYQPQIDQSLHAWLGKPEGEAVIRAAFVSADRAVGAIAESLLPGDALIVTGDHGLVVAQREVRMNQLLAERGFAPRWRSYSSGSVAHLYRFPEADDADAGALIAMLSATGQFERVEKKAAEAHRNSGDVIAWGWPDVALSSDDREPAGPAIGPATPHGQHGALTSHREMHPPLFALGAGIPPGPAGEIAQTRIARIVTTLLGIAPPDHAD